MILATRDDELARACADDAIEALAARFPGELELHRIAVEDPDERLSRAAADVAVHRGDQLPLRLPSDSVLAYLPRRAATDALIAHAPLAALPPKARIETSSARRRAMLLRARQDLAVEDERGHLTERVESWRRGESHGVITATAAVKRLGIDAPFYELDAAVFVPGAGQGAIACVGKAGSRFEEFLGGIDDERTHIEVEVERSILLSLGGNADLPIGVRATKRGDSLMVHAVVLSADGQRAATLKEAIDAKDALYHADDFSEKLRGLGADVLLAGAKAAPR